MLDAIVAQRTSMPTRAPFHTRDRTNAMQDAIVALRTDPDWYIRPPIQTDQSQTIPKSSLPPRSALLLHSSTSRLEVQGSCNAPC
jgi:hypothetical protein